MSTSGSGSRSALVLELAEEFLDRYRAGEHPPLREYIERHPELAADIREVFPAMAMMENIALTDETIDAAGNGSAPAPRLVQLGDFRVLREVGRGGMGIVYEAEQVSLGRHVALKVLPPQSHRDSKHRRRFEREARAAARLHHTNIVPVFGVGEHEETPYYVMQFIQGQGLDAVLDELKRLRANPAPEGDGNGNTTNNTNRDGATAPMTAAHRDMSAADVARSLLTGRFEPAAPPPDEPPGGPKPANGSSDARSASSLALPGGEGRGQAKRRTYWEGVARLGHQVAEALAYAHAQGIVHRDIKPSNLLLDNRGTVWVADFGLAKAQDQQDLTHTGDLLGTLRYMPPEAFGGKAGERGDIYALGLTLYEMLAFRPAFDESDRGRLVKQVTTEAPPRLKKLNPEVPRDLETIVQKAIERDPSHRYATAADLADDLRRFADDEPVLARRASNLERLARWGRRNPMIAALASAVGLLTLAALCGLWYGNESARRALRVQTALRGEADARAVDARRAAAATAAANEALTSTQGSLRRTLYAAQINLAQAAWDSGSPARSLELLEATRPKPGAPDFRGFEWDYFRRQAHRELAVRKLPGFERDPLSGSTQDLRLSSDGALAATVQVPQGRGTPPLVIIRETATGRLVRQIPVPALTRRSSSSVRSFSLEFSADGARLALAHSVVLRSGVGTGTDRPPLEAHAFVWSLADGRELLHDSGLVPGTRYSAQVGLSRDGARIALLSFIADGSLAPQQSSGDLRVLDVADGRERLHQSSALGTLYAGSPQFSPDGRLVAATSVFGDQPASAKTPRRRLVVFEVESGRARTDVEDLWIPSARIGFSPDGRFLAVTTLERRHTPTLVVCDLQAGRRVATENLPSALGVDAALTFSPDGRLLILASTSGPACQVRELPTGRLLGAPSLATAGCRDLVVRPSDGVLLTIDPQGNVREWPALSAQPAALDAGRVLESAGTVALADGGRKLIALKGPVEAGSRPAPDHPAQFTVYDVTTGQVLRQFVRRPYGTLPYLVFEDAFCISTQGSSLLVSVDPPDRGKRDYLEVWDSASGQWLRSLDEAALGGGVPTRGASAPAQAFDARGTRLAVPIWLIEPRPDGKGRFSRGSAVSVIELPSGRLLRTIPDATLPTQALALRPDGKLLALGQVEVIASGESRVRVELRDPDSGQLVRTLRGRLSSVGKLAFSPDGRWLAAATHSSFMSRAGLFPLEVWDLAAGATPEPLHLDGHGTGVQKLAFSADGRRLATLAFHGADYDCELKLWDVTSGRDLFTLAPLGGRPIDLAFDPDGRRLRVLMSDLHSSDARIALLDASPLAPEIEAIDLVDRLAADVPLNSELVAKITAEPGLDPAVRAAGLTVVPLRQENGASLMVRASTWLGLDAPRRTPELMRRALEHADHALALVPDLDYPGLATLGEARYRNGRLAECLEPFRQSLVLQEQDIVWVERRQYRALAFIAMAEAKLGHREPARAALDDYRKRHGQGVTSAKTPAEDKLLAEAEAVFRAAFGVAPTAPATAGQSAGTAR
jgi:serine/threonine protein kinase/WD40 repeat protein